MLRIIPTMSSRSAKALCLFVAIACCSAVSLGAGGPSSESPTVKFVLHPARAPAAALQFALLPKYVDRTAGNAAPIYLKALLILAQKRQPSSFWEKVDGWLESPPAELPRAEVRAAIEPFGSVLAYTRIAAHRDHCDWDPPLRESDHPFEILLPEVQELRAIGRLLALQARLQIADEEPIQAIATLQTGFAMAKHASEDSFLVNGLVGQAIANSMVEHVGAVVQSKNCPNLYWTLTALPNPFIDFRSAADVEAASIYQEFPQLRDVEHAQRTADEWQSMLAAFVGRRNSFNATLTGASDPNGAKQAVAAFVKAAILITQYPTAKAGLIAAGRERTRIEAMPPAQAILAYAALCLDRSRDEVFKWYGVPYRQAREGMAAAESKLKNRAHSEGIFSIGDQLVPAFSNVRVAQVRAERRMAALRIVESIRMYAALHEGELPARLDELSDAPAPLDPVTGQPFEYKLADGAAVLEGKLPIAGISLRYELRLAGREK